MESERKIVSRSVVVRKLQLGHRNALKKQYLQLFFIMPNVMNYETRHYKTLLHMTLSHFQRQFLLPHTLLFTLAQ